MNCAEVMEWMHRYLDHDLSPAEKIEMFRHIDSCPSCTEILDQLTLLHQELEHLPDVSPPFSLVDSILPRLDELDRAGSEAGYAVSAEPAQQDVQDEAAVVPFSRKSTRGKSSKGSSIATRTGIGAAAAAVLLGIALFNMPESLPGAQVESMMQSNADTAGSNEVMNQKAMKSDSTAEETSTGDMAQSNAPIEDNSAAAPEEYAIPATPSPAAVVPNDPTAPPDERPGSKAVKSQEPVKAQKSSAPKSTAKPDNGIKASPSAEPKAPGSSEEPNAGLQERNTGEAGNTDGSMQDSQIPPADDPGIMSLVPPESAFMNQAYFASPDGQYTAEVADQQLHIYHLPAAGPDGEKQVVTSLPLEGALVSAEWSADGRQFTYVTEQADGNVTNVYTLQPEASPTATNAPVQTVTPSATPEATPPAQ
ncbi:hypothetical protein GCM10010912_24680 [Paenibacillus albidus]|uniref:Anti-sigma-W factor RsiW n=1 Tax=Paenibacillus albidus TaxID=2041023 RepID=A0A917CBL2_9BACL|nr:zf-HC2 domain-containing protein [Paenibacillus albidus]GGF78660.1 hypothetical protein GCM10010912_24680 [Paenibacillus albidus]